METTILHPILAEPAFEVLKDFSYDENNRLFTFTIPGEQEPVYLEFVKEKINNEKYLKKLSERPRSHFIYCAGYPGDGGKETALRLILRDILQDVTRFDSYYVMNRVPSSGSYYSNYSKHKIYINDAMYYIVCKFGEKFRYKHLRVGTESQYAEFDSLEEMFNGTKPIEPAPGITNKQKLVDAVSAITDPKKFHLNGDYSVATTNIMPTISFYGGNTMTPWFEYAVKSIVNDVNKGVDAGTRYSISTEHYYTNPSCVFKKYHKDGTVECNSLSLSNMVKLHCRDKDGTFIDGRAIDLDWTDVFF